MSTVSVAPKPTPKLGPTPIQVPMLQAYMLGDFMRAFGIDEQTIQLAQQGFSAGDFSGLVVRGMNTAGVIVESTTINFAQVSRDATLMVDTASPVSITGQLSRRLERAIVYSAETMRRKGLRVGYVYLFSAKAIADYHGTLQRYSLVANSPDTFPPGMAMRQIYSVTHRPTGATVTHAAAWRTE